MDRKVIDYKLISSSNPSYVEKEVKKHLKDGWELLGGISMGDVNRGSTVESFCQALVKYDS
ncbi:DUF1737 domain-containing protein [Flammeovirgaceae bacterium SG7u.111]|nr:DUF1737 domain-containing protein [Flammeovirgaceae bacterium SG7u.111]